MIAEGITLIGLGLAGLFGRSARKKAKRQARANKIEYDKTIAANELKQKETAELLRKNEEAIELQKEQMRAMQEEKDAKIAEEEERIAAEQEVIAAAEKKAQDRRDLENEREAEIEQNFENERNIRRKALKEKYYEDKRKSSMQNMFDKP